jgi:hypothetical protein
MPYPLIFHCWLFAPDSATRNRLYPIYETAHQYDQHGYGFDSGHSKEYFAAVGTDLSIKNALRIMKCAEDCVGSRRSAMRLLMILNRRFQVMLPRGCEAPLMDIIMQTLQSRSDAQRHDKCIINDNGNEFLE